MTVPQPSWKPYSSCIFRSSSLRCITWAWYSVPSGWSERVIAAVMNSCGAGRHPSTRELVNTMRSPSSTARKQPSMCGPKSLPDSLIEVRKAPPGRGSQPSTRHSAGAGIHHFSNFDGSIHALHTAARGALITREMVKSREGSIGVIALHFLSRCR